MGSTRGKALLVTADAAMGHWMTECMTSIDLEPELIHKILGDLGGIPSGVGLCLIDEAGLGGSSWQDVLIVLREQVPLVPAVLVSHAPGPVPAEALGMGILDVMVSGTPVSELQQRLDRAGRAAVAALDLSEALAALRKIGAPASGQLRPHDSTDQDGPAAVLLLGAEDVLGPAAETLRAADLAVTVAQSLEQARQAVSQTSFRAMVVDNDLSDARGLQAMRELASTVPEAAILFVVGFTAADDAVQALRWGASSFLIKPVSTEQILDQVRALLDGGATAGASGIDASATPRALVDQATRIADRIESALRRLCTA